MASNRSTRSKRPVRTAPRAPNRQLAHPVFAQPEPTPRDHAAPILAAAGNHDGMVAPHIHVASLEAGHVHNYQRFTRDRSDGTQIAYICCGNGGHNVQRLSSKGQAPLRAPQILQKAAPGVDQVVFENYDDINYGYLRIVVTAAQLHIQYHAASDGPNSKAPDDSVTVDLATRRLTQFSPTDLGQAARVAAVQRLARSSGK